MEFSSYANRFISAAAKQGYTKEEISELLSYAKNLHDLNLPIIYDQYHFSLLVGYDYPFILSLTNSTHSFYRHYEIPKKDGNMRPIDEPYPSLKEIQTWILDNILTPSAKKFVSPVAKAFIPKKSLIDNARFHKNKGCVVAMDIHDFFGSIHFKGVYGIFKKMGYTDSLCTLFARLCTYKDVLPQGAPTSSMLSNLFFWRTDEKIFNYCRKRKVMYTRYADDMIFSSDSIDVRRLIIYVTAQVEFARMEINEKKTKVMGRGRRQNVTGVVVNDKLQVSRQYRERVRQEVYYVHKYGIVEHMSRVKGLPAWIQTPQHYANHLYGKICFILQINPKDMEFQRHKAWLKQYIQDEL